MGGRLSGWAVAGALAVAGVAVRAAPPVPALAPSTKWQMDYAPGECRLLRSFGDGRATVTVQFSKLDPSPSVELTVVGRGIRATDSPTQATVSTSTVATVEGVAQGFGAEGRFLPSLQFQPNNAIAEALAADAARGEPTRLNIAHARGYRVALDLGLMKAPLAALDRCVDDLMTTMGLAPAEQRARKSAPEPLGNPGAWFRSADYPASLNRLVLGGIVLIRLVVGPDGAITDCAVVKSGGDKAFADLTCRLITERARFTPALSAFGQPIASLWTHRIRWQPAPPLVVRGD